MFLKLTMTLNFCQFALLVNKKKNWQNYFNFAIFLLLIFLDVEQNTNGFPNWLLHILGTQAPMSEMPLVGTLEEPHYYCQGDGLGKFE